MIWWYVSNHCLLACSWCYTTLIHTFITSQLENCSSLYLCWPPSWAVAVLRPGPVLCCTPLWTHPKIWPFLQLAPTPTEDLVPNHGFSLAVVLGVTTAHLQDLCCTTLSVPGHCSLRSTYRPFCSHWNQAESCLLSGWMGYLWHRACSLGSSFTLYAHLKLFFLAVLGLGVLLSSQIVALSGAIEILTMSEWMNELVTWHSTEDQFDSGDTCALNAGAIEVAIHVNE